MIPQARILEAAKAQSLLPTTVEKDYVLGWMLYAIANHTPLSTWVFKGGTCLKKCYFETYRFSEDLDFTIPVASVVSEDSLVRDLGAACDWIEREAGIRFPKDGLTVERYQNKRGNPSYQAKATYVGPLNMQRRQSQRIKFDLTQDEVLVDSVDHRSIVHMYEDAIEPPPTIACYSINEVLAEKTRALYERQGRARDVYDVVQLSRTFRDAVDHNRAKEVALRKFGFKDLPPPSVEAILQRIDQGSLKASWSEQLSHQLPFLAPVDGFIGELAEAIGWWLEPAAYAATLAPVPLAAGEQPVPRELFPVNPTPSRPLGRGEQVWSPAAEMGYSSTSRLRYAARNHLVAQLSYDGVQRLVEPYSLRRPKTGNLLLYVHEQRRGGAASGRIKAFKVDGISNVTVTDTHFQPRYRIEL